MSGRKRRSSKNFIGPVNVLPKYLTESSEMRALSARGTKLLVALLPQFNGRGRNNGDIRILMRQPLRYGFKSVGTLTAARDDLLRFGFLQMTAQGGLHRPSRYAFTWEPIDKLPSLDVSADTKPSDLWMQENAARRELPMPCGRKGRSIKPAPISRTQETSIAPISGTTCSLIAPINGAVRPGTDIYCALKTGTDL